MYYSPWPIVTDCNDAPKPLDFCPKTCHTTYMKNETAMTAITFENNPKVSINGTCLQGYIETTYDELVKVFGKPTELGGYKITVEWILQFSDGTVASIYDWKLSETPMGTYRWHIGGKSQRVVDLVHQVHNQVPV